MRWFEKAEAEAWMPLLSTVMWLPTALDIQLERDAEISHYEFEVLAVLSMQDERTMRLSELARIANSSLSRLSKVVSRLAKKGWVERRPDPDDGRTTLATLTDAGLDKVTASAPGHVARVRELIFDQLTPTETEQLAAIMTKISDATGLDGACAGRLG